MGYIVNIYNNGQPIDLDAGKYKIDALGGWGVDLGKFAISFKHRQSGEIVNCERPFWPVQSFAFDKRAKRIFMADIVNPGIYEVNFANPDTLKMKHGNLFLTGLFQQRIPNRKILVYIR